jgi:hypothetical protein
MHIKDKLEKEENRNLADSHETRWLLRKLELHFFWAFA